MNQNLVIASIPIEDHEFKAVIFTQADDLLTVPVIGIVGNSITTSTVGKKRTSDWKMNIAAKVREAKGKSRWEPKWQYAISIGFSFHQASHGNQPLDVENYLKPSIDALAAGLFSSVETDLRSIPRFSYDDSNFKYLFVYKLPDAKYASEEGAGFVVSALKN